MTFSRAGAGSLVGRRAGHEERQRADEDVERHGSVGRRRHVVHTKQIEAREQAADDGAAGVAAVEVAEPRHALRARLDPARHRRKGRAHQDGRWQEEEAGDDGAKQQPERPRTAPGGVDVREGGNAKQDEQPEHADADLEERVNPQRVLARRDVARQKKAPETHAAHERPEQDGQRDRRRANHELKELEPDDLVNEGSAAAGDKQQQQRGHVASRGHQNTLDVVSVRPGPEASYPAVAGPRSMPCSAARGKGDAITLRPGVMIGGWPSAAPDSLPLP